MILALKKSVDQESALSRIPVLNEVADRLCGRKLAGYIQIHPPNEFQVFALLAWSKLQLP